MKNATKKRATKRAKKFGPMVRISGETVRVGTKRHEHLVYLKKLAGQNFAGEHGDGMAKNPKKRRKTAAKKRVAKRSAPRRGNPSADVREAFESAGSSPTSAARNLAALLKEKGQRAPDVATLKQMVRWWERDVLNTGKAGYSADRADDFVHAFKEANGLRRSNPRRRRRNSAVGGDGAHEAKKLYRKFHQTGSHGHRDVAITTAVPVHLAQLGRLIELHVAAPKGKFVLKPSGVTLTSTPDGKQMYFVGGDQVPPLSTLGVDGSKVHVSLGTLQKIVYLTRKGFHNFEPVEYVHRMGEEGGVPPDLNYDTQSKLLYLVGGTYRVKPAGITN